MARAMRVARIELQPWAMLANGPPWMNAGVDSVVCTRLGMIASFKIAAIEPVTPIALASTGWPLGRVADQDPVEPGPQVGRRVGQAEDGHDLAGRRDVEARLARHALRAARPGRSRCAASARSFISRARFHRTRVGSRSMSPKWSRLSIAAASRLWAAVIAWKSPVNWRLIVFDGSTRLAPPPVAPPLRPKTGPIDGWRRARAASWPIRRSPWARPIDVVVFPSPAGVGVMAETRISLPARPLGLGRREGLEPDLRLVAAIGLEMLGRDFQIARQRR